MLGYQLFGPTHPEFERGSGDSGEGEAPARRNVAIQNPHRVQFAPDGREKADHERATPPPRRPQMGSGLNGKMRAKLRVEPVSNGSVAAPQCVGVLRYVPGHPKESPASAVWNARSEPAFAGGRHGNDSLPLPRLAAVRATPSEMPPGLFRIGSRHEANAPSRTRQGKSNHVILSPHAWQDHVDRVQPRGPPGQSFREDDAPSRARPSAGWIHDRGLRRVPRRC